ncbi:MAG: hypothetical protein ACTSU5_12330 [Promethearchaeota archaeon]
MFTSSFQTTQWDPWLRDLLSDPQWGYYRGVHLYMWLATIIMMYMVAMVFVHRSKAEGLLPSQKWLFLSYGLFLVLMGATRIAFVVAYFVEPWYHFLLALGYAFGAVSLLPIVFTLENFVVTATKHVFSIIGLVLSGLSFVFLFIPQESELSRTIQQVGMPFLGVAFFLLYLWLIKMSVGRVRTKAILTLLGILLFIVGTVLDSESLIEGGLSYYLSPPILAAGVVIIGIAQKTE